MNLHEYQAKQVLAALGLPVLRGFICHTPGEVEAAADALDAGVDGRICVVKAQMHAGGRGKAGGVKLAKSGVEARAIAENLIGKKLVSPQTGPSGKLVRKVYVEAGCNIGREMYLSLLVDRGRKCLSFVASTEGGVEIEEVAHKHPERIKRCAIDPKVGYQPYQGLQLGLDLGLAGAELKGFQGILEKLYRAFLARDLSLLEINPLVLTKEGQFVLLDAKVSVDDNALFRQKDLRDMLDYDELDPRDLRASHVGVSYVGLDGDIGCMVNGAGLAMSTLDIIKQYGGNPSNFLDVGGGASKETVTEAFKLLLSDSKVKAILVNIFGGIMRCDVVAQGVVAAAKELNIKVPLVVRLQGTNVELGRKILSESGIDIRPVETMDQAGKAAVEALLR